MKPLNEVLLKNLYSERQMAIQSGNGMRLALIEARIKQLKEAQK